MEVDIFVVLCVRFYRSVPFVVYVPSPAEIKLLKQRFINEMYAIAQGRFGVLIDTYGIAEHYGLDPDTLTTVIEYWEAKGFIATYEGTLYASLTLNGVESLESGADLRCEIGA